MSGQIYCTWKHRALLPPAHRDRFRDLDHYVRELASSAKARLIIVSPYLSPSGADSLRGAIAVSVSQGAWVRLVTDGLAKPGRNRSAIQALLSGPDGEIIRPRLRVLSSTDQLPALLHAKLLLIDRERGYLGSANMSGPGLSENFEVGTALQPAQVEALDALVSYLESAGHLADQTELF